MTANISTLGDLLNTAGTQWRVYDMGRKIKKIDKPLFNQLENGQVPYPYPLAGHALIAIQFWDNQATVDPYVWFLKLPLDEQSKLVLASRDHFANMVLEALGTELTGDQADGKLDNNPYVFTPNANKLAAFNALLKTELKRPASQYYEFTEQFFVGNLPGDAWQSIAVQGLADFAFRLDHGNNNANLTKAWVGLPQEVQQPLSAMLEHVEINTQLAELFFSQCEQAIAQNNLNLLINNMRALSGGKAHGLKSQLVELVLTSNLGSQPDVLLTLAGRYWGCFEKQEALFKLLDSAAKNDQIPELFPSIFADLVAIPSLRPHVLGILRAENRSDTLSRAIGRLFS